MFLLKNPKIAGRNNNVAKRIWVYKIKPLWIWSLKTILNTALSINILQHKDYLPYWKKVYKMP